MERIRPASNRTDDLHDHRQHERLHSGRVSPAAWLPAGRVHRAARRPGGRRPQRVQRSKRGGHDGVPLQYPGGLVYAAELQPRVPDCLD